jgi:hypothetical protein
VFVLSCLFLVYVVRKSIKEKVTCFEKWAFVWISSAGNLITGAPPQFVTQPLFGRRIRGQSARRLEIGPAPAAEHLQMSNLTAGEDRTFTRKRILGHGYENYLPRHCRPPGRAGLLNHNAAVPAYPTMSRRAYPERGIYVIPREVFEFRTGDQNWEQARSATGSS